VLENCYEIRTFLLIQEKNRLAYIYMLDI